VGITLLAPMQTVDFPELLVMRQHDGSAGDF